jgi:hypothetical protein
MAKRKINCNRLYIYIYNVTKNDKLACLSQALHLLDLEKSKHVTFTRSFCFNMPFALNVGQVFPNHPSLIESTKTHYVMLHIQSK